jgi:hypothetical protein
LIRFSARTLNCIRPATSRRTGERIGTIATLSTGSRLAIRSAVVRSGKAPLVPFAPRTLRLRKLPFELPREFIQLTLCFAQRFGLITQHSFRGALNVKLQVLDVRSRALFELAGLAQKIPAQQLLRQRQLLVEVALIVFPQAVIKLFRQQRLGDFGLLRHALHLLEQVRHALLLLLQFAGEVLGFARIAERLRAFAEFIHLSCGCPADSRQAAARRRASGASLRRTGWNSSSENHRATVRDPVRRACQAVSACGTEPCSIACEARCACSRA